MPEIIPFQGYRYNRAKVKKFGNVVSPPYDVISPKEQMALYRKSPYNFVRIDLRRPSGKKNLYQEAAKELESWIKKGIVLREEKPSIYVYLQNYRDVKGKAASRLGFLSLMKLSDKVVKKHENTLTGPKKDRQRLTETLHSQLSPIFGLAQDRTGRFHKTLKSTLKKRPVLDVTYAGVRHRLYQEADTRRLKIIQKALQNGNMYIADGHHRYEVAYQYHKRHPKCPDAGYVMTYLCDAIENDFTIYPTHRVLKNLPRVWRENLDALIKRHFHIKRLKNLKELVEALKTSRNQPVRIGCLVDKQYFLLKWKRKGALPDVSVLHDCIIQDLLGEDVAGSKRIEFVRPAKEAEKRVLSGASQVAFFLSTMPIQEMMNISDKGIKLPQKSTYFYPKLLSGLVFYKFA